MNPTRSKSHRSLQYSLALRRREGDLHSIATPPKSPLRQYNNYFRPPSTSSAAIKWSSSVCDDANYGGNDTAAADAGLPLNCFTLCGLAARSHVTSGSFCSRG